MTGSIAPPRPATRLPTDAQVLGAVNRVAGPSGIVVCAAGGLPGELHKLWRATDSRQPITSNTAIPAWATRSRAASASSWRSPDRDVFVLVGDGCYLMMNSEIATSVAMGAKLTIVVLDNRGFGCINRLQRASGGAAFNNLLGRDAPAIDFAAHAAQPRRRCAKRSATSPSLEAALAARQTREEHACDRHRHRSARGTDEGGAWWDVAVTEAPRTQAARAARRGYERARRKQRIGA